LEFYDIFIKVIYLAKIGWESFLAPALTGQAVFAKHFEATVFLLRVAVADPVTPGGERPLVI
jgi:hypothetical protein